MKKILLAAAIVSIFNFQFSNFNSAHAQQREHTNYLGLDLGGGLGSPLHSAVHGDAALGLGFGAGLHYAHFFGRHFGLGLGVNYNRLHGATTYDFTETTAGLTHASNPGVTYDLVTTYDGWRERQMLGFLSVPLELLWRWELGERSWLVAGLGAQLELPLHGRYTADEGTYATSGYFPAIGHTVENLPQHGFGTYNADTEADIEGLKPAVSLVADLGVRLPLGDRWGLYVGAYGTFGLTNMLDGTSTDPLLVLDPADPSQALYNGTFASAEVDGMRLLRAGVKVAIDFGWSCGRTPQAPAAAEEKPTARPQLVQQPQPKPEPRPVPNAQPQSVVMQPKAEPEAVSGQQSVASGQQSAVNWEERLAALAVTFDFGQSEPHFADGNEATLRQLAAAMQADTSIRLHVTGHTDNIGSERTNRLLGRQRAQAVRQRLIALGIPADRIATASRGMEQPIAPNDTPEGRARNRRADIKLDR
ncbi:MAG: OmpA family protein [Bacteroidales bacterium]|nr:OmpA family protein [Bacteroidales bacterium]